MNPNQELIEKAALANLLIAETRGLDILEMEACLETPTHDIEIFNSLPQGPRMLDVGCCTGRYADRFLLKGFNYVGIDHSPTRIRIAKARHPNASFETMDYRDLSFPDGSFDRIWSCCVFHYEPKCNIATILKGIRKLLSADGVMLVVIPWSPVSDEGFLTGAGSYISYYTPSEFQGYLVEAGFQCQEPIVRNRSFSTTFLVTK